MNFDRLVTRLIFLFVMPPSRQHSATTKMFYIFNYARLLTFKYSSGCLRSRYLFTHSRWPYNEIIDQ